jgi:hypothetical protein
MSPCLVKLKCARSRFMAVNATAFMNLVLTGSLIWPSPALKAQELGSPEQDNAAPTAETDVVFKSTGAHDRPVGTYKIGIGLLRPDFNDGLIGYEETYANVSWYPAMQVDWMPLEFYRMALGLKFSMGMYKDEGRAIRTSEEDETAAARDDSSRTNLLLLPLAAAVNFTANPFSQRWVGFDAWAGIEYLYYQETRGTDAPAPTTTPTAARQRPIWGDLHAIANKAWKRNSVYGVSVNLLLNWMDAGGPNSMRGSLGLGYVYLSPFVQISQSLDDRGASFGRQELGIAFRFESIR